MFSLVLVQLKPQQMPKTEVGSLKLELDDLGGCAGLPVFTFHKDGGSKISPQLPEISKVDTVFVQIKISFPEPFKLHFTPCLLNWRKPFRCLEQSLSREEEEKEAAQEERKGLKTQKQATKTWRTTRAKNLCQKLFICGHRANKSLSFLQSFFGQS